MELQAMRWLRFEKRCPLAFFERGPRSSRPDVLGVLNSRYMVEIEIKRSASDFKADAKKWHIANRADYLPRWPRWFYYLVTPEIVGKIQCPSWAGLMVAGEFQVLNVITEAPVNPESEKLSVQDTIKLVRVLGNQILSTETKVHNLRQQLEHNHSNCGSEYQI
jgi:hypothetical protein